jgi:hypothetical protein
MRLLASIAMLAGIISALPIDSALSTTADVATVQGQEAASDYGPPHGSYGDGGNYGNYGPPPTPFPYQGGGYVPGQFTPPPPPRSYSNGYNAPNPIAGGIGNIVNGVGQLVGGTTAGLVGGLTGEFLHGVQEGRRRGYRLVRRESKEGAGVLLEAGRRVGGWIGLRV